MKKILAIFMILQLSTNHEAFAEMAKIPFLFIHYSSHHHHHKPFSDFLHDHYTSGSHSKSDHDHAKLPFKHCNDGCSNHPSPNISVVTKTENAYSFDLSSNNKQGYELNNDNLYSCYFCNIWQPPKLS